MEDNFKNIIIGILILVLIYLVYTKMFKSNFTNTVDTSSDIMSGMSDMLTNSLNIPSKILASMYPSNSSMYPSNSSMNSSNPSNPSSNCPYTNDFDRKEWENKYYKPLETKPSNKNYANVLEPINSNTIDSKETISNLSDNELIHIDDSKPYLANDNKVIDNSLGCNNTVQLESESHNFNYDKKIPENLSGYRFYNDDLFEQPVHSSDHSPVHSSDHAPVHSSDHAPVYSSDHSPLLSDHAPLLSDHAPVHSSDHAPVHSSDHAPVHSSDHAPDQAPSYLSKLKKINMNKFY